MKRWHRPVSGQEEEEKIVEMEWVVLLNNVKKRKKDRPGLFGSCFYKTVLEDSF